jgi:hypothetical protein
LPEFLKTSLAGFSWYNLKSLDDNFFNQIPRNGGSFVDMQLTAAVRMQPTFIYAAMFDEYDEGTAFAKAASTMADTPNDAKFLYLSVDGQTLASDHYLGIAKKFSRQFGGPNANIVVANDRVSYPANIVDLYNANQNTLPTPTMASTPRARSTTTTTTTTTRQTNWPPATPPSPSPPPTIITDRLLALSAASRNAGAALLTLVVALSILIVS